MEKELTLRRETKRLPKDKTIDECLNYYEVKEVLKLEKHPKM